MIETEMLAGILSVADSILILFIVVMSVVGIQFYRIYSKDRKEREKYEREDRLEREKITREMVEVLTGLKLLIENLSSYHNVSINRLNERVDNLPTREDFARVEGDVKKIL